MDYAKFRFRVRLVWKKTDSYDVQIKRDRPLRAGLFGRTYLIHKILCIVGEGDQVASVQVFHVELAVQGREMSQAASQFIEVRENTNGSGRELISFFSIDSPEISQITENFINGIAELLEKFRSFPCLYGISHVLACRGSCHSAAADTYGRNESISVCEGLEQMVFTDKSTGHDHCGKDLALVLEF